MIVDCAVYHQGHRHPDELPLEQASEAARSEDAFVWIDLEEPSLEEFDKVAKEFGLHALAVEDAVKAHQRPKLEVYGETIFMVLKTARYVDTNEVIEIGELLLFVGQNFVIVVRHGDVCELDDARKQIEAHPEMLKCGPGAVLHAIIDRVVDDYAPAVEGVDNDIEEVEDEVFNPEQTSPAERIYRLKREVLEFHRATATLVPVLERLAENRIPLVDEGLDEYFRDVHDHLLRVVEHLAGQRDLLTSVLDANLAQVGVQQNEDMRKISAWVAIVAVPTMIAGVYGMNFDHMPELRWLYGYPAALGLMAVASVLLYRAFRKSGWL